MKKRCIVFASALAFWLVLVQSGVPAYALHGAEAGPPIQATDMQGQRVRNGAGACDWKTESLVVGLGESCGFMITAWDEDIYYDPYPVYDNLGATWSVTDSAGHTAEVTQWSHGAASAENPATGRFEFTFALSFCPWRTGTYRVSCTMDDDHHVPTSSDPADKDDDPPITVTMTFEVQCSFRIKQIYSTDETNIDSGSPKAGLVGAEIEYTAGQPPTVTATHTCPWLSIPQTVNLQPQLPDDEPCDFPETCRYVFDSGQEAWLPWPWPHNGDWTLKAEPSMPCGDPPEMSTVTQDFTLRNLTVEASPRYLCYDADAQTGNTITYSLHDAFEVCPAAQETDVDVVICRSDGTPVRTDSFVKTAARNADFTYVWDGKDDEGNPAGTDVYTYSITALQDSLIPHPPSLGGDWLHYDEDMDKSRWSVIGTSAAPVDYDSTSDITTFRVGFEISPACQVPPQAGWYATSAEVEVFDPDAVLAAVASYPGHVPVLEPVTVDVAVPVRKPGDYVFFVTGMDGLMGPIMNSTHAVKPLQPRNSRSAGAAVCMYYGNLKMTYGIFDAWNGKDDWTGLSRCWFADGSPPNQILHHAVPGCQLQDGRWKQMSNPAYDHAWVATSSIWGGAMKGKDHVPPWIWVILAHGGDGDYTSKFLTIHEGVGHKCAIAADHAGVSDLSGWNFSYVSDIPTGQGPTLAVLAACSSSSRDGESGQNTIGNVLRSRGAANVLGFSREVGQPLANHWLVEFFKYLYTGFRQPLPLDTQSIKRAAIQSQNECRKWADDSHYKDLTGDKREREFLVLNGVTVPWPENNN